MNRNSEKTGNMNLPEASTSERKMTIHLPETSSTNTEMGVSLDTLSCLYISIEIHTFRKSCYHNAPYSFSGCFMFLVH